MNITKSEIEEHLNIGAKALLAGKLNIKELTREEFCSLFKGVDLFYPFPTWGAKIQSLCKGENGSVLEPEHKLDEEALSFVSHLEFILSILHRDVKEALTASLHSEYPELFSKRFDVVINETNAAKVWERLNGQQ